MPIVAMPFSAQLPVTRNRPQKSASPRSRHSFLQIPVISRRIGGKLGLRKEKDALLGKHLAFRIAKECREMSKNNNNQLNIPEAREAMDKFKMTAASEVGVDLKQGYNGHLTSREAGSVGGQMVKKMIEAYEQNMQ